MKTISRHDAFVANLKRASNDIYLTLDPLDRAYYATDNPDEYKRVERMIEQLLQVRNDIEEMLDKS